MFFRNMNINTSLIIFVLFQTGPRGARMRAYKVCYCLISSGNTPKMTLKVFLGLIAVVDSALPFEMLQNSKSLQDKHL